MIKDIIANDFKVYLHLVFGKHLDNEITHTNISINKELSDTLKKICINYVNEIKEEEKFIEDFNIVGSNDGVIEKYDITNNFMGIPNILDLLNDENRLTINDEDELKEYKYFIIEDNKLVYEDREQAKHIVALMQDAYYETYIGKEQGTDTRR
ncbi:hypothetical protein CW743_13215 [Staphylococcus shinii]|uniref:hypothetical protein n=1 Tax=Staphylococcus shinii TaxID=2912228 RepID=UPI000C34F0BF|nr:hypothetical protein [Staphylococcus shinii]PKI11558.1 hypothetical protein CW743_13215 [Staphylococcus shinii]